MIPLYKPWITDLEKRYVQEAIESSWISSRGPFLEQFENDFSMHVGTKYAIATCNGTCACHLALLAAGIRPGDKVLVPNLTFVATANAVKYCGAIPIFIDVDPNTWNMDLSQAEEKITDDVKAIFCVHLLGNPCDYEGLKRLKEKYGILIIEDCAEAIGASYKNMDVGSWFDVGVFSFFGNKTITTGEGGAITTSDKNIYQKALLYKGQGQTHRYFHSVIGYNYRMTNVAAAIGCAQLQRIREIQTEKDRIFERYRSIFSNRSQKIISDDYEHGNWIFAVTGKNPTDIEKNNIFETRRMFYPLTHLPPYRQYNELLNSVNSYKIFNETIMLPSYPELTNEQIDIIIKYIDDNFQMSWFNLLDREIIMELGRHN